MSKTTFRLRTWTRFFAPVEAVWQLKTSPADNRAEFRPWFHFHISNAAGLFAAIQAGQTPSAQAWMIPPGIAWPLTVVRNEPGVLFEDHSQNMLYSRFEHQHLFQQTPDGCRYIDDVIFTPRLPTAKLAAIVTQHLFIHRHRVAARSLDADTRTVGTSVLRVYIEGEAEGDID